jgi:hypothetical protein
VSGSLKRGIRNTEVRYSEVLLYTETSLTTHTIKSGFITYGIYPFNIQKVLDPLQEALPPMPDLQIFDGEDRG